MKQRPIELDPATCEWHIGYADALADIYKLWNLTAASEAEVDRLRQCIDFLIEEE